MRKRNALVLIDTLPQSAFRVLESSCRDAEVSLSDVRYVLFTHYHCDHAGNAREVKELSGAKVVYDAEDVPFVEGKKNTPWPSDLSLGGRILWKYPESLSSSA